MTKRILVALLGIGAVSGCQNNELEIPESQSVDYHAKIERIDSKTTLDSDRNIIWNADDMVSIFNRSTVNGLYKVKPGTEGDTSCTLIHVSNPSDTFIGGMEMSHVISLYPYSGKTVCLPASEGAYTLDGIEIGVSQTYCRDSFSPGSFPMAAVSTDENLSFRNVCGALALQFTGDASITSVTLQGNAGEKLSGEAKITVMTDGDPSVEMKENASETIVLDCGAGVKLSRTEAVRFIIAVPPTKFASGFTVTLTDTSGKTYEFKTEKENAVGRSHLHVMPAVDLEDAGSDLGGNNPGENQGPVTIQHEGLQYVWDENALPEITMTVSVDEWNRLLGLYDQNSNTKEYVKCNITYKKGSEVTEIIDAGFRLRGNTSRRRPEGNGGEMHRKDDTDWHHCHFGVNLRKFNKDNDDIKVKDIHGIRKFNLKWFKDDACYVRELFCYDLFRRAGIWTAAHDVYCRLWIQVEGDSKPAYYGVYEMIEPYDNKYVEKREHLFGSAEGNLWKCSYDSHGPADLRDANANMAEDNDRDDFTYELKETEGTFEAAKAQLQDFILKLNGKGDDSFYKWIKEVCDVELLMKTYAVNVAVGMWDDMWNNGNNYYLYFNSLDLYDYKVFLIPYDYDNTLGTANCYDPAKQDPYNWGDRGILMERLMKFEEFRNIYRDELKRLVDPANGLMDTNSSVERIKTWQSKIKDYLINDTGEDMYIEDKPAGWGSWGDYNLMSLDNNYFTVKAQTINALR